MLWVIIWGTLANAVVLLLGMAIYKSKGKKTNYTSILIANAIFALLAFIFGFTSGFDILGNNSYIAQTVAAMSFGMIIFCFIPLIFLLTNKE